MKGTVLVLHGFNSAPGQKSVDLKEALEGYEIISPELPADPTEAIPYLTELVESISDLHIVGTSLGGFYSLILADALRDRDDVFIYAINPAYTPSVFFSNLEEKIYTNYKTGKELKVTVDFKSKIVNYLLQQEEKVKTVVGDSNISYYIGSNDDVIDHAILIGNLENLEVPYRVIKSNQDHRHQNIESVIEDIKKNSTLAY